MRRPIQKLDSSIKVKPILPEVHRKSVLLPGLSFLRRITVINADLYCPTPETHPYSTLLFAPLASLRYNPRCY